MNLKNRRSVLGILAVTPLLASTGAFARDPIDVHGHHAVTVMTRNVYHGVNAELNAAAAATGLTDFLVKTAAVYRGYFARNFPERAAALAAEIEAARPDLVALQEAVLVRTQSPADGPRTAATAVELDFVQILLDALAARGMRYEVAVQSIGFDIEVPTALGIDLRHTDREVILVRAGGDAAAINLSNAQAGHFANNCAIPSALLGPIVIRRGWASVDVKTRGRSFRFVSTHLDGDCLPFTSAIQQAQAAEILAGPAATDLPVIFAGDLNSPGDGSGVSYNQVIAAGFVDAAARAGLDGRPTCCQADDLLNPVSQLATRIDFVLFRGDFDVRDVQVFGDEQRDRTPSGFWPSDHAGVAATLGHIPRR